MSLNISEQVKIFWKLNHEYKIIKQTFEVLTLIFFK